MTFSVPRLYDRIVCIPVLVSIRRPVTIGLPHLAAFCRKLQMKFSSMFALLVVSLASVSYADPPKRVGRGLQVLYDFSGSGKVIRDRSEADPPIDLTITNMNAVKRRKGSLQVIGKAGIRSKVAASRLNTAVRRSGEITIEAWVNPSDKEQDGPARIVTVSKDGSNRNVTLGQDGNKFDVRFRTSKTSTNGIPSLATQRRTVQTKLAHLAYTRDRSGKTRIFMNGKAVADGSASGKTSNWDPKFQLGLADEISGGRIWMGTYHLVAVYSRDLSPGEVSQNFRAGANAETEAAKVEPAPDPRFEQFITKIAPLLSNHCLECHDAASQEGGLDLSRKHLAMAGGDSGLAIVPGKASESLLWESVANDEMPQDRTPLSKADKELLHSWIASGAVWPLEKIDPAVYLHDGQASGVWVRRLTIPEYIETVRSVFGVEIADEAQATLPSDKRADGFRNTSYNLTVDMGHVQAYADLARTIVDRMDVLKFASQFQKSLKLIDDDMRGLIEKMGKRVLRGPLSDREIVLYRGITTTVASAGGDAREAVAYVIEAMLQSPRFIYRVESQRGKDGEEFVDDYELASRIAYIVWGAPPDRELWEAAESGELFDDELITKQVERMMKDPRAINQSVEFLSQWLNLGRLDNLKPSPETFPDWDADLAGDMREETIAFFREIVWEKDRPLADLFNAQLTFATPRLAKYYGLRPSGDGIRRYDLQGVPARGGLLSQASVLTIGGDEASMVTRGLFVLHDLLRGVVKDPPPCVNTTPVPTGPGLTQRAIAEERIALDACGGCHAKFEPLAFGLEKFDGLGAYSDKDHHGNSLREDGEILIPGEPDSKSYQTSAELMNILAESERVRETITWKLTQFALGRPLGPRDAADVAEIHRSAQKSGGTYANLMSAIVLSDLVRKTRTQE